MEKILDEEQRESLKIVQEPKTKFLANIKERIKSLQENIVKFSEWEKCYDDACQMVKSPLFTVAEKATYIEALINANVMCTTKQEKVDFILMSEILKTMLDQLSKPQNHDMRRH